MIGCPGSFGSTVTHVIHHYGDFGDSDLGDSATTGSDLADYGDMASASSDVGSELDDGSSFDASASYGGSYSSAAGASTFSSGDADFSDPIGLKKK